MYPRSSVDEGFALRVAQSLAARSELECHEVFADLLRNKQLSHTVHFLNKFLRSKNHAQVARSGLCRLGFPDDDGK